MQTAILALPAPTGPGPDAPAGDGGGLWGFLPFLLILFVVLLFMPLFSKKERTRQKRLQTVKKHDRVVTSGGLYGTVISIDDQTATLEVAKGVRLTFKKSSIYDIDRPGEGGTPDSPEKQAGAKG